MSTLTPDYLSADFQTLITRIKKQMKDSDTFADYNFEGANITLLIELLAYVAELNTYFINKVAKNIHIETADVYEAANRNARQMGYEPKGPVSSRGTATITVSGATIGNTYRLDDFTQFECPEETYEGETIKFANTIVYNVEATASTFDFDINVKQGEVTQLTGYKGSDLINNELYLPDGYAYDNDVKDEYPSLALYVDGERWVRVADFYDYLSALIDYDDVYMFVYDRYGRSKVVFNTSRNIPGEDQEIEIHVLQTLGRNGNVGANSITGTPTQTIYDVNAGEWVNEEDVAINNDEATFGAANAEDIDTIRENAKAALNAQSRNVTREDYIADLESRSDVTVGQSWGEQDVAPSGSIQEYNKVHLSVIPSEWGDSTISVTSSNWTTTWNKTGEVYQSDQWDEDYKTDLIEWVEPKKIISTYEVMELPNLIYFSFDWGVRIKRLYNLDDVATDIINKLDYYFRAENQEFNSVVNFNDIIEYIMDTTETSEDDDWENIKGIRNLNLRDIDVNTTVYEYNEDGNYPYYVEDPYIGENNLRNIQLGLDQFPKLSKDTVEVEEEF